MKNDEPIQWSVPFEVICINDNGRPREIPPNKWLTKGQKYTVNDIGQTLDGNIGFKLEEIELDESCFPYDCFNHKRFGIPIQEDVLTLEEELKALGIEVEEYEREPLEV